MATITDSDLALFRERAKTELKSTGDIGRLAWDDVVDALCKEVARLRSVSKERGDASKLREAQTKILNLTNSLDEDCAVDPVDICDIARAALAEPVKNCEVGTVEEMAKRMDAYCARNGERIDGSWRCDNCPLCSINRCDLAWAQMPYEEGGAK